MIQNQHHVVVLAPNVRVFLVALVLIMCSLLVNVYANIHTMARGVNHVLLDTTWQATALVYQCCHVVIATLVDATSLQVCR